MSAESEDNIINTENIVRKEADKLLLARNEIQRDLMVEFFGFEPDPNTRIDWFEKNSTIFHEIFRENPRLVVEYRDGDEEVKKGVINQIAHMSFDKIKSEK